MACRPTIITELDGDGAQGALVGALQERSYACIRLPKSASVAVDRLLLSGPAFFSSPSKPVLSQERYYGFHASPEHQKQVLFVRLTDAKEMHPPRTGAPSLDTIAEVATTAFRELHTVAARCLSTIARGFDILPERLEGLLDSADGQPQEGVSSSYMSLLQYGGDASPPADRGADRVPPCVEHVDYSLLTLIPFTDPGLEVLDLKDFGWVEQDGIANAGCEESTSTTPAPRLAVLMVGESLEFLSGGRLSATAHKVAQTFDGPRLSCPLLMYPRDDALLDPSWLSDSLSVWRPPQRTGEFIAKSQRTKDSAVYDR